MGKKSKGKGGGEPGDKKGPAAQGAAKKKGKDLWPIYAIGGLLLAGVIASGMVAKLKRGDKGWGVQCATTIECAEGICFPGNDDINRCTPMCDKDQKCPPRFRCVTKAHPRRKSLGILSICEEK